MTGRAILHPEVHVAARAITQDCPARDDRCELEAIFRAVKHGDARVPGMGKGFRYVADPVISDYFVSAFHNLRFCKKGACAGDCDDHAALVAALAGSVGFRVGLRAYGKTNEESFSHVYAVAKLPKRQPTSVVGLDSTVPDSFVGWEPPPGRVLTAWVEE